MRPPVALATASLIISTGPAAAAFCVNPLLPPCCTVPCIVFDLEQAARLQAVDVSASTAKSKLDAIRQQARAQAERIGQPLAASFPLSAGPMAAAAEVWTQTNGGSAHVSAVLDGLQETTIRGDQKAARQGAVALVNWTIAATVPPAAWVPSPAQTLTQGNKAQQATLAQWISAGAGGAGLAPTIAVRATMSPALPGIINRSQLPVFLPSNIGARVSVMSPEDECKSAGNWLVTIINRSKLARQYAGDSADIQSYYHDSVSAATRDINISREAVIAKVSRKSKARVISQIDSTFNVRNLAMIWAQPEIRDLQIAASIQQAVKANKDLKDARAEVANYILAMVYSQWLSDQAAQPAAAAAQASAAVNKLARGVQFDLLNGDLGALVRQSLPGLPCISPDVARLITAAANGGNTPLIGRSILGF